MDKNDLAVKTYNQVAKIYSYKYFDDTSDLSFIDKFLDTIPSGGKILDIGCGPGQFSKYMSEKGFSVEGIDLSSQMVNLAKQNVPDIKFKHIDMRKLEYPKDSFEGILCAYSLIHIRENEIVETLKGFRNILKANGKLFLITQKGDADKVVNEPLKEGLLTFVNFFDKTRLSDFLKKSGFKIITQNEIATKDPDALSDKIIYTLARKI